MEGTICNSTSDFPFDGTAEQLQAWLTSKYGQQTAGKFSQWTPDELLGASEESLIAMAPDNNLGRRIFGALQTAQAKRAATSKYPSCQFLSIHHHMPFHLLISSFYSPSNFFLLVL